MSLDFSIIRTGKWDDNGSEFFEDIESFNITHNLVHMAEAIGVYGALWHPEENGYVYAKDIINVLDEGLTKLQSNPEEYKKYEPDNGWGTVHSLMTFIRKVLDSCNEYPNMKIKACR